jgi:hypothetical protein
MKTGPFLPQLVLQPLGHGLGLATHHVRVATTEPEPDLLAPPPTGGHLIGYARTSQHSQILVFSDQSNSPARTPAVNTTHSAVVITWGWQTR